MGLRLQEERRHLDDLWRREVKRLGETERPARLALAAAELLGVVAIVSARSGVPVSADGRSAMHRSDAVEDAAVAHVVGYERARGWEAEDASDEGRGYDLLSRGADAQLRYIEVKGRAGVGAVELSANESLKAEQLGDEYWLYIMADALGAPALYLVQDPARRLPREEVVPQVRYRVSQKGWNRVAEAAADHQYAVWREKPPTPPGHVDG